MRKSRGKSKPSNFVLCPIDKKRIALVICETNRCGRYDFCSAREDQQVRSELLKEEVNE